MKFKTSKGGIEIFDSEEFNPTHILECGQVFSYKKFSENSDAQKNSDVRLYDVFSADKKAEIFSREDGFLIKTRDVDYFVKFFDLERDYSAIKSELSKREMMKKPIEFGSGIRILRQNLFETLISFIVSANNNIKRIQMILERMRSKFGKDMGGFHAFPTREELLCASIEDFARLGAGYRSKYLFKVVREVDEKTLDEWKKLPTATLRNKLISLSGVGPKVADCVLLFGYGRGDVFPVDTWIEQMFHRFYGRCDLSREQIRKVLTDEFGALSGYAQQYLFFFMRSGE